MIFGQTDPATDPTPSPSPGPPPIPPDAKPWHLDPPPGASRALAGFISDAGQCFQALAKTLGAPQYAVEPPTPPPARPAPKPIGMAGLAIESLSKLQNVMERDAEGWLVSGDGVAAAARRAATIGSIALQRLKDLVARVRELLSTVDLTRSAVIYAAHDSFGGELASETEYQLFLAVDRALAEGNRIVQTASAMIGNDLYSPIYPPIPMIPRGLIPPSPVPMPRILRSPQGTAQV